MIKYQYAKDENGKLIDIISIDKAAKDKVKFFCVSCNNELIPKLGNIKKHHFAHKKVVTCSGETYLHKLGKELFYENYIECLEKNIPFFIEVYQKQTCNHYEQQFQTVCKLGITTTEFDLTQYFDKIHIETREGIFIPDVMLISKSGKDKVFIEIAVTHLSSDTKLKSDYRIIELDIEEESDFEPIKEKFLSIRNSKIKFNNFKINELTGSICNGNCKKDYSFFTLDTEGRGILKQRNLKQISQQLLRDKDIITKHYIIKDGGYYPEIFKYYISKCSSEKLKVNNCFICRYHGENNGWGYEDTSGIPIFCKFLKIKCNSNQAVNCECFKPEKKYIDEHINNGQESMRKLELNSNECEVEYDLEDKWFD